MATANRQATDSTSTAGQDEIQKWGLPVLVLVSGMFMSVLDTSIINVAVPTIENTFGETTDEVAWIVTAYALTLGVVIPISAWLSDRFGAARVYLVALAGFGAGSALCGLAWSLDSLILFRIVQAIPGGLLPPLSMAILYRIVPSGEIGRAMGMFGLGVVVAPAVGPTLGGYLVEYVDWRLIFLINVPISAVAAFAAFAVLPKFPPAGRPRFDTVGFVTIAIGLFSLLLALSEGSSWGWTSFPTVGLFCLSAVMLALFVVIELEVDQPLLDVRVFSNWQFTNSVLLIAVLSIGMFVVLFYVPVYLQRAQGAGALDAGIVLLPQAVAIAFLMPVAGLMYDRLGPRIPAVIGLGTCAFGNFLLHDLTVDTPQHVIALILALRAAGMGLAMMPVMTGGLAALQPERVPSGSAFNNVTMQASAALGLAVIGAVLTATHAQFLADRIGFVTGDTPLPQLGPGPTGHIYGMFATYESIAVKVFVEALTNAFVLTTALTLVGLVLAFTLRSGPAPEGSAPGTVMI